MWELQRSEGDPRPADLIRAKEYTREMMERGLLRGPLRPRDDWKTKGPRSSAAQKSTEGEND